MGSRNRFLTLDDLYAALSDRKRSFHFDAEKTGTPLLVHSFGQLNFDEDNATEGLTAVEFVAANTGENLNHSYISYDVMKDKLMPTFRNRPILGYIHDVDGEPCFYTHNMHIDSDTDEIVYDEIAVGIIPESNDASLEYNEEEGNYSLKVTGYLFNEYTKAVEILSREKECAASVEIAVSKMGYDAKSKVLNIEDGYFAGITILGKDEDGEPIEPGMKGANVKLKDFVKSDDALFSRFPEEFMDTLAQLHNVLDKLNFNGKEVEKGMPNEDFENKKTVQEEEENQGAVGTLNNEQGGPAADGATFEKANGAEGEEPHGRLFSNGGSTYELSHNDIRNALYNLLDAVAEQENDWYYIVDVYDDHFIYENFDGNKMYGQKYTKNSDVVEFDGDRYDVYCEYLTQEEKDSLDSMRQNYAAIEKELNEYKDRELAALREDVISDEAYADFANEPEFREIKDKITDYSVEDLRTACDLAFAKCVKRVGSFEKHNKDEKEKTQKTSVFAFGAFDHKSDFLNNLLKNK